MKIFIQTFSLIVALTLAFVAAQARAQDDPNAVSQNDSNAVSFQTFYDQLASQGTWIQTQPYGYVWQPTENDPNWRPYTYGHWVNTDQGMTWDSDEPFGWATYHYGRWTNLDNYGWVWVPGYTWAPAWVSWRDGDDEVGWAPLPPSSDVGIDYADNDYADVDDGYGYHIGDDCDQVYGIGAGWYNFCPVVYIGDRDAWRHFNHRGDNFAFIGRTRNVTNINFRRDGAGRFGHVRAEGPSVAALNSRARTPIGNARLASVAQTRSAGLRGNTLGVFAPRIDPNTVRTSRPGSFSRTAFNADVNRGTDINRPLAVNSRVSERSATPAQVRAAALAQANLPSNARVATTNTRISRPLTQPLTTLRPAMTRTENMRSFTPTVRDDSRFTGEPVRQQTRSFSNPNWTRSITPQTSRSVFYHSGTPVHSNPAPVFQPQRTFQSSAPQFHSSMAPAYHPQATFQRSAPAFHSSPSFQPHFSGGAPAQHFSGGGGHVGGGGARSVGGASAASGHAGGGRH